MRFLTPARVIAGALGSKETREGLMTADLSLRNECLELGR